jgi:poly(3-hydroxybutyrate) depolymerase
MLKKHLSLLLASTMLVSMLFTNGAFAADYNGGTQGNEATFETLQEARVSSPAAVVQLDGNAGKTYVSHPALDGYPEGTTFVYRSANMYGGRAAARMNTNILVFSDQSFADKDAALTYLKELGLINIIDQALGSVVLVTPSDPEAGFTSADQKYYYALQTAMLSQKASVKNGDETVYYSDGEYFGGFGYLYVVGIDGGATFLNNYVAGTVDYVGRIAGMLLVNGKMDTVRNVAALVPAYLVNATDDVVEKYKAADKTDASMSEKGVTTYFNQALPLQKVVVANAENPDVAGYVQDAYYNLFIKAMRVPVGKAGLNSAGTPYQNYNFDEAPYSLCDRNAVIDGVTADGINVTLKHDDRFSDLTTEDGSYLMDWFEYLPQEVLDGSAADGSVPLVLALHGGGDDPAQFVDEIGLLSLSGKERFAIVAPDHTYIGGSLQGTEITGGILSDVLPRLVNYMLETYPALDASRVYVTGYSMGGSATLKAANGGPSVFAAAVPMSAAGYTPTDEQVASFKNFDMPVLFTTSTYDLGGAFDQTNGTLATGYQTQINIFLGYNEMATIDTFDFSANPINGFAADSQRIITLNGEYKNFTWTLNNADGIPMVAVSYTQGLTHALYPEFAKLFWDFAKHYSRDTETHEIVYDPYVQ